MEVQAVAGRDDDRRRPAERLAARDFAGWLLMGLEQTQTQDSDQNSSSTQAQKLIVVAEEIPRSVMTSQVGDGSAAIELIYLQTPWAVQMR